MRLALLGVLGLLLTSAATHAAAPQDPTRSELVHQLDLFAQRMHDKQENEILASYSRYAVFEDPSGQRFSTPAQLRKLYDHVFAAYDSDLHLGAPTILWVGHSAHLSGTYTETLRDRRTGQLQHPKGEYRFHLMKLSSGEWTFTLMQWTAQP